MWSILYSLWESSETSPSFAVSMLLSFSTWASGLYSTMPDYFLVDLILSVWTVFHLFVAITIVSGADAIYKRPLMELHCQVSKFVLDIPMMVSSLTLALTLLTARLSWTAYNNPLDAAATLRAVVSLYTWVCSIILQKLSTGLVKVGVDYAMKVEQELERHDIKAWKVPPKWTRNFFAPISWILRPVAVGAENIPTDHPGLYVMNHALGGLEMAPFVATVYDLKNIFLRGLADNIHFGHLVGEFIRYFGGVNGTRDNVDTLMENRDNILVYPGGGHEIMKPCAVPNYTLMWKERLGFARVAIKRGYPIIPCASVGTEDMLDRLFDINLEFVKKDLKCPVVFLSPHKLQRVYFWFGEPIPTAQYDGDYMNDKFATEVRDKTKAAVEAGIRELQERQAKDPNRFLFNHMANATKERVAAMMEFCDGTFGVRQTFSKKAD